MSKVVIFGVGKVAEVVHYYLMYESEFDVAGFTCDSEYIEADEYMGLPIVPFDNVESRFPPGEYQIFVALGYQSMNDLRTERLNQARAMGYQIPSYVNPNSGLPKDTTLGENCFIMNNVCIQPHVQIGDNVFVWSGALIGHHSNIGSNCWITSNANIAGMVSIGDNCFVAVNATVGNDVSIGARCFLGANCLVTKDLDAGKVVVHKSSEVQRLTSDQFLRISKFH